MSELRLRRLVTLPRISFIASSAITGLSWALFAERTAWRKSLSSRVRPFTNLYTMEEYYLDSLSKGKLCSTCIHTRFDKFTVFLLETKQYHWAGLKQTCIWTDNYRQRISTLRLLQIHVQLPGRPVECELTPSNSRSLSGQNLSGYVVGFGSLSRFTLHGQTCLL